MFCFWSQGNASDLLPLHVIFCCCSVIKSCPTFCTPLDCSTPGFPVLHCLPELAQSHVHELVMPSNHLILSHPLLQPSVFPSTRVFSNESALHIRWPNNWSFSIGPSNEYPGLTSFRDNPLGLTGLISLQSKGLSSLLQHHNSK